MLPITFSLPLEGRWCRWHLFSGAMPWSAMLTDEVFPYTTPPGMCPRAAEFYYAALRAHIPAAVFIPAIS